MIDRLIDQQIVQQIDHTIDSSHDLQIDHHIKTSSDHEIPNYCEVVDGKGGILSSRGNC